MTFQRHTTTDHERSLSSIWLRVAGFVGLLISIPILLNCSSQTAPAESTNPVIITISSGTRSKDYRLSEFMFYIKRHYPEITEPMDAEMQSYIFGNFQKDLKFAEIARGYGIRITDDQVSGFIKDHLGTLGFPSMDEEERELWRKEIKRRMAIRELLQRKVLSRASITDDEVGAFYEQNEEKYKSPTQYTLRFAHIATANKDDGPGKEAALAKADDFRKSLQQGKKTFMELAPEFVESEGYQIATTMNEDNISASFRDAVARLSPGRYSNVIPVKLGDVEYYYVLYLESMQSETEISYEDAYHDIVEELLRRRCRETLEEMLKNFDLSTRFDIQIHAENLPFTYTEESQEKEV